MIEGEELSCLAGTLPYLVCDEEDVILLTEIIHGCLTLLEHPEHAGDFALPRAYAISFRHPVVLSVQCPYSLSQSPVTHLIAPCKHSMITAATWP